MGAYDSEDGRLVGTSCSEPIVCISNNDVPKNAPYLPMHIPVSSAWPKWQLVPQVNPCTPAPITACKHACIHTATLLQIVLPHPRGSSILAGSLHMRTEMMSLVLQPWPHKAASIHAWYVIVI